MKKKKQNPDQMTDHHILPSSRGGSSKKTNIKRVPRKLHEAYHTVFKNLTPDEIHQYLEDVWFNPKKSVVRAEIWLTEQN